MARTGKKKKEDEDARGDDPWAWTLKQGVKLTGDQYSLPDGTTAFWKSELRRQGESIPWGKTHTPQGDDLVASIQSLDANGVTEAIETFSDLEGDKNLRVATTLLYRNHVRTREQEDAHDEASPMLHVLSNAESIHQETSNSSSSDTTTTAAQDLEERVRTIAEKLLDVGVHPATRGDYRSAVSYAAEKEAFFTLRAMIKALKARGEMVSGGVTRIGTTRQNLRYGGGGTDVFWMAAKSSDPRILPMVFETLKDELGENQESNDRKAALGRLMELSCTFQAHHNLRFLLDNGGSPEGVHFDKSEEWCDQPRPLHYAANQGTVEVVKMLLEAGASIHTRCVNGLPIKGGPLHHVCRPAFKDAESMDWAIETARLLIQAGCDVNQPSVMERKTPLRIAIRNGNCDMMRFLIVEARCSIDDSNAENEARKHKNKAVGREYVRSVEERQDGGQATRRVRSRISEEQDLRVDFPSESEGDLWRWDEATPILDEKLEFHPKYGLFKGDEQLAKAQSIYEDEGQIVESLSNEIGNVVKGAMLRSDGDSPWRPFFVLGPTWYKAAPAAATTTSPPRRRSRRGVSSSSSDWTAAASQTDFVKEIFKSVLGVDNEMFESKVETTTIAIDQLKEVMELEGRHPAVRSLGKVVKKRAVEPSALEITLKATPIAPKMICFFVNGLTQPHMVGIYATKTDT